MIMLFHLRLKIILFLCCFVFSTATVAEMYKWVDEEGNTHYSQSPPVTVDEVITIKPPTKVDTEAASKAVEQRQEKLQKMAESRYEKKQASLKAEEEKAAQQQKCQAAKERLSKVERPRVQFIDGEGNVRRPTQEEYQQRLADAQAAVDKYCQ
jgi:Domain of unknown function (DUF4124)